MADEKNIQKIQITERFDQTNIRIFDSLGKTEFFDVPARSRMNGEDYGKFFRNGDKRVEQTAENFTFVNIRRTMRRQNRVIFFL